MKERTKPKENQLSVEEQRKLVKENLDATLKLGQKWSVSSKFSVLYSTGIWLCLMHVAVSSMTMEMAQTEPIGHLQ